MNRIATLPPLLIALALAVPLAALAQTGVGPDTAAASVADGDRAFEQSVAAERRRIADRRTAAYARYGQDRRDCWQRFAVNDCLDRARERRRAALDALRHDELALNAQERERRTAARLDEIARKQAASAERNSPRNAAAPASSASDARPATP